jgi:hypothetical protein
MNFSLSMLYGGVFPFSHLIYNALAFVLFLEGCIPGDMVIFVDL